MSVRFGQLLVVMLGLIALMSPVGVAAQQASESASSELPPPGQTGPNSIVNASSTERTEEKDCTPIYKVSSGFDLDQYLFRESSPLEFQIEIEDFFGPVSGAGQPAEGNLLLDTDVLLTLRSFDVDAAQGEVDHVFVNGEKLDGMLTGANDQWSTDTFQFPASLLKLPAESGSSMANEFYIDIDTTNDGWAVQVDWAELRFEVPGVCPVIFVHGITGTGSSLTAIEQYFVANQPSLRSRTSRPTVTLNGSAEANAAILKRELSRVLEADAAEKVDLVVHSFGGLNARVLAKTDASKIRNIVMIGSPNGGSELADFFCKWHGWVPKVGQLKDFGECSGPANGLYQLQTTYVQDVFNRLYKDSSKVSYATVAGSVEDDGSSRIPGPDDNVVSVASVRWLAPPSGRHQSISPIVTGQYAEHSPLKETGSPALPLVLCHIYSAEPKPSACGSEVQTVAEEPRQSIDSDAPSAAQFEEQFGGTVSGTVAAMASEQFPLGLASGEEGVIMVVADDALEFSTPSGSFESSLIFEAPVKIASVVGPTSFTVQNPLEVEGSFVAGLIVFSERGIKLEAPSPASEDSPIEVNAVLSDPRAGDEVMYSAIDDSGLILSGSMVENSAGRWSAQLDLEAGDYLISARVENGAPRGDSIPVRVSAESPFGQEFLETAVDLDADGFYDRLDVEIPFTPLQAGDYQVSASITSPLGFVASASTAVRSPVQSSVVLSFDGSELFGSRTPGPWMLGDVALVDAEGTPQTIVDELGVISNDDFNRYEHDPVLIEGFADRGIDSDANGKFESLVVDASARVDIAGQYAINAKIVDLEGAAVARTQSLVDLDAGTSQIELSFDGATIGTTGLSGPFVLRDLSIYLTADSDIGISLVDAYETGPYRSDQFPGGSTPVGDAVYFSGSHSGSLKAGEVSYNDEDVVGYDAASGTYALVFDGSDVGIRRDVDAFALLDDGSILMSFDQPLRMGGVGLVDDSDVLRFVPDQLGGETAGTFEWFLDGSDVLLTTGAEDIDALAITPEGALVVSTIGVAQVGTVVRPHDLMVLRDAEYGADSAGSWEMYLDGSDVSLQQSSERLRGTSIGADGTIFVTTWGRVAVPGVTASGDDILACERDVSEPDGSTCTWSLRWEEMVAGYTDGLHVGEPSTLAD